MAGLTRIWIRADQKRIIKKKAAENDMTITDALDDFLGCSDDGLIDYEKKLKKGFKKIL